MGVGYHVVPDQVMFQRSRGGNRVNLTASLVARFTADERGKVEDGFVEMGFPRRGEQFVVDAALYRPDSLPPIPAKCGLVTVWWVGPDPDGLHWMNAAVVFGHFDSYDAAAFLSAGKLAGEILSTGCGVLLFRRLPDADEESWVKDLTPTDGGPADALVQREAIGGIVELTGPATPDSCIDAEVDVDLEDPEDDDAEEAGPDVDFAHEVVVPLYRAWRQARLDPGAPWPGDFPNRFRPRPAETPFAFARRAGRLLVDLSGGEEAAAAVGGGEVGADEEWMSWVRGVMEYQGDQPTSGPEAEPEAQAALVRALVGQVVLSERAVAAGRKHLVRQLQWTRQLAAKWVDFKRGDGQHPTRPAAFPFQVGEDESDRLRRDETPEEFARTVVARAMHGLRWSAESVAGMNAAGGIDKYAAILHATTLAELQRIQRWSPIPGLEDWNGPMAGAGD